MTCPKCNGEVYDNRADKASGAKSAKWPDFKCKDKSCDWALWPEKQTKAQVQAFTPPASQAAIAGDRHAQLNALYWACFDEVMNGLKSRAVATGFPGQEIVACVATLFIARSKV